MATVIDLNTEQQRAAHAPIGPTLVSAGPGSGKTRVAIARVEWLINSLSVSPSEILVFTFTNRAARDLRQRLAETLADGRDERLFAGTFHSWGAQFLRRYYHLTKLDPGFSICDQQESDALLRQAMVAIKDPERNRSQTLRWLRRDVSRWKSEGKTPSDVLKPWRSTLRRPIQRVPRRARQGLAYEEYQNILERDGKVDFDDLIAMPLRIISERAAVLAELQRDIHHIIVDEYQDTSRNQHLLVSTLANREGSPNASIFVVGDTDQAIYGFRNADIRNLNNFSDDFPASREIHLENNYRSSQEITDAAQSLIERNRMRLSRVSHSIRGSVRPLQWREHEDPNAEADFIAGEIRRLLDDRKCRPEDICVTYRTNPQSRPIEEALNRQRVLYQVAGNYEFYKRAEVRRYLDYLRAVVNPLDAGAVRRIINVPPRGIGPKSMEAIEEYVREHDVHLRTALLELALDESAVLSQKPRSGLKRFVDLLDRLRAMISRGEPVADLIKHLSNEAGLLNHFNSQRDGHSRVPNILELEQLAAENADLDARRFLERTATNREQRYQDAGRVTLSSIHQTKGLEFDRIYVAGVEEQMLPHRNSLEDPANLEEERRLMYVAMTRARLHLTVSWCCNRPDEGRRRHCERSRFIDEIPPKFWEQPLPENHRGERER